MIWNVDYVKHPLCGDLEGPIPSPVPPDQIAFVMGSDGRTIDQRATIQTFGHPDGGYSTAQWIVPSGMTFLKSFRPIGASYSVFAYRKLYYFDTFFDGPDDFFSGDFEDKRKKSAALNETLGVFLRRKSKTAQMCEYHVTE